MLKAGDRVLVKDASAVGVIESKEWWSGRFVVRGATWCATYSADELAEPEPQEEAQRE